MKKKPSARAPGYVFSGLGLCLVAAGAYLFVTRAALVIGWRPAAGTVVESRVERADGRRYDARIRVRFEAEGQAVETDAAHDYRGSNHAWVAETVARHPPGTPVLLRYDPGDPQSARLNAGWNVSTFWTSLLAFGVGALFAGIGALAFRSARLESEAATAPPDRAEAAERRQMLTVGGFVLAIGLAFLAVTVALAPGALRSRGWPVATARVESGERVLVSPRRYAARLYVSFDYEGRRYSSSVDVLQPVDVERALIAARGGTTEVRFDPDHPHRLFPRDRRPWILPSIFLLVGLAVTAAAGLVIRLGLKKR